MPRLGVTSYVMMNCPTNQRRETGRRLFRLPAARRWRGAVRDEELVRVEVEGKGRGEARRGAIVELTATHRPQSIYTFCFDVIEPSQHPSKSLKMIFASCSIFGRSIWVTSAALKATMVSLCQQVDSLSNGIFAVVINECFYQRSNSNKYHQSYNYVLYEVLIRTPHLTLRFEESGAKSS